jgi:hypothetical protein
MNPKATPRPVADRQTNDSADPLHAILDELRADQARNRRRPSRSGLLAAIAVAVEDRAFNAAEVIDRATVNPALAAALDAA